MNLDWCVSVSTIRDNIGRGSQLTRLQWIASVPHRCTFTVCCAHYGGLTGHAAALAVYRHSNHPIWRVQVIAANQISITFQAYLIRVRAMTSCNAGKYVSCIPSVQNIRQLTVLLDNYGQHVTAMPYFTTHNCTR